jgi:two-component sensor histidine kinase
VPRIERLFEVAHVARVAERLQRDRLHDRQRVLHAVVELANTHSLLASVAWGEIDLRRVLESEFAPYQLDGRTRVQTSGDHVRIKPAAALALSMSVHELLTNASKYGALSTPDGFVQVAWRVVARARSRRLRLAWSEHGGPRVAPPTRLGFGSRLITEGLPLELDAEVELDYAPEGVNCTIEFPLAAAIAPP